LRNLTTDHLRQQGHVHFQEAPEDSLETVADTEAPTGLEHLLADEHAGQLQQCLDQLPPHLPEVVRLRYEEELQQTEIAQQLGVSNATVSRRLHTALAQLRHCLEQALGH
jgi:RNA polymerase sigma factor (sigma-70 family)